MTGLRAALMLVATLGIAAAVSCDDAEKGSGRLVTEDRQVSNFSKLDVTDGLQVEVSIDSDTSPSITVTADDNLIANIRSRTVNDRLVLETTANIEESAGSVIRVVTPALEDVHASAGSLVMIEGVAGTRFNVDVNSGAVLDALGNVGGVIVDASSGAIADLEGLVAEEIQVNASSGARIEVQASKSVTGDASSGAAVRIHGDPDRVLVETSSGASVEFVD